MVGCQRRIGYMDGMRMRDKIRELKTNNPIDGLMLGTKKTYFFIMSTYATIKAMATTKLIIRCFNISNYLHLG